MLRLVRQDSQRHIGTHGAYRFFTIKRHWFNNGIDILAAVTKYLLVTENRIRRQAGKCQTRFGQVLQAVFYNSPASGHKAGAMLSVVLFHHR